MTTAGLNLIFPQWQGSGRENSLYHAARAVPGICPELDFLSVPVPETCGLSIRNKILGFNPILSQMKAAKSLIHKAAPDRILTIGGDCGTEVMPVSWLNHIHSGNLTIVWLDAHADLNTPQTSPSGHFHGMPLATLLGHGDAALCNTAFSKVSPGQVILAGLRNPDPSEATLVNGMTRVFVNAMEISSKTDPGSLAAAVREKGNPLVYLHIDLDVLDPGRFPHVGCPEPDGLMPDTLIRIVEELADEFCLAGMGLMEFTLPNSGKGDGMDSLSYVKRLITLFKQATGTCP